MSFAQAPTLDAVAPVRVSAARGEAVCAALCLAQFSEPLFAAIAQSQGATEPPGFARIFFLPAAAFLVWAICRAPRAALSAAWRTPVMMAMLALAFASALWSIDGGGTFRRAIWLTLTMGFGLYLAWRYEWAQLIAVIAGAFAVLIAGSFALALFMPAAAIMPEDHPGAWSGLWTHKNTLGGFMALGVAVCAAAALVAPRRRRFWLGLALAAFALVLLSTSKTALLASGVGLAMMAIAALMRRGPLHAIVIIACAASVVIVGACAVLFAPEAVVAALGRDLTFTGRTDIWNALGPAEAAKPWLGFGYYAFWLPDDGPAYWVREAVRWKVSSAHNGWLELSIGIGAIGVALAALQMLAAFARGAGALFDPRAGLWAPAFLVAFAFYTMSESHILQANDLFWTIYVAVVARLALDARDRRHA